MSTPEALPEEPLILLDKVSKVYPMGRIEVHALRQVTLGINQGEFVVIMGPSGSGKTTLLNLIGGIDSPTSGRVVVDKVELNGLDEKRLTEHRRKRIGFVFQFFNLIPTLTARENVEFAAELSPGSRDVLEVLEEVGLRERADHFPSELSGGEQQRVAIARALVKNPPILLCDEPTGELDFETGKHILGVMRRIKEQEQKTVVLVTHNAAIGEIADRVVRLRSGEIVEVKSNPSPLDPERLRW
jgi:putative ABC transport system ATP-binding protein